MERRVILVYAILAAAGAGWWWHARTSEPTGWQGYAKADFVKVGPTLAGLLTSVLVERRS